MTKTIMVVDDEKRLVSLVESYLTQEGYRVVTAHNGLDALSVARREKPDLIVLDVMMPEMDGYEFMRKHRADNNTPNYFTHRSCGRRRKSDRPGGWRR